MSKKAETVLNEPIIAGDVANEYTSTLQTIVGKIKAAQTRAIRAVNVELVSIYRDIG